MEEVLEAIWRCLGRVKVVEWRTCWGGEVLGELGRSLGSLGGAEGERNSWGSGEHPFGWEENVLGEWMMCWEI